MKHIAILGFGIVGSGIARVLEQNAAAIARTVGDEVGIKYILDLRDFPDSPYADRVIHEIAPILDDPEVALVCETMGGSHPALEYSLAAMEAGKSVVSSNKEVVANYGDLLLRKAREHGVSYLFEASVGGGIPLIRPFLTSLASDRVTEICGIVNGTTNYILTKMKDEGRAFGEVLAEAQRLGYAERDPSADIDGIDAKRKIIILTALASGILPEDGDVYAGSIRGITVRDIEAAERVGGVLRLIARTSISDDGRFSACVTPMIVGNANPLAHVNGVYNAVSVTSPVTGDILYYGRGAGSLPTAGAVLSDVAAILSGAAKAEFAPVFRRMPGAAIPFDEQRFPFYVRADGSAAQAREKLEAVCGPVIPVGDGAEFETGDVTAAAVRRALPDAVILPILR
ncbi:MAG: homoserine dehydrogenase [Clostridiales bacterium]|nr:homoserine dehydrogenase [Clostridiales bacterium]